jgi:hypothetical protein
MFPRNDGLDAAVLQIKRAAGEEGIAHGVGCKMFLFRTSQVGGLVGFVGFAGRWRGPGAIWKEAPFSESIGEHVRWKGIFLCAVFPMFE